MRIINLDNNVQIHRLKSLDGTRQGYTTYTLTMECTIQPSGDSNTGMAGGGSGKNYRIFLDVDKNIQEGDKLKDKNGNWYKVAAGGVENRNDGLIADYMVITAQKIN